jgi:serine/threonine-protein kinase
VAAALPGGDPLAAALAAGETPSPELVAAARDEGLFSTPVTAALLVVAMIGTFVAAFAASRRSAFVAIDPPYSADVLSVKASELLQRLRPGDPAVGVASRFDVDRSFARYVVDHGVGSWQWQDLPRVTPAPLHFWYRTSPSLLAPREFPGGSAVSPTDPPRTLPGMALVITDVRGRLIYLDAKPSNEDEKRAPGARPPWPQLFQEAGLDLSRFTPADSEWLPLSWGDTRAAWTGTGPQYPVPLRVEAAAYRGRPTFFVIAAPWTTKPGAPPERRSTWETAVALVSLATLGLLLIAALLMARASIRSGRADRRGAARLAGGVAIAEVAAVWLFMAHAPGAVEVALLLQALIMPAIVAALGWVLYIGLEPYIRRTWPSALISWSRIVGEGRVRDARVARDVLIGLAAGGFLATVEALLKAFVAFPPRGMSANPWVVASGLRFAASEVIEDVTDAILIALILLLLISLFRMIVRRDPIVTVVFAVIVALAITGPYVAAFRSPLGGAFVIVYGAIYGAVWANVVIRFGLVAFIALHLSDNLLSGVVTLNPSVWYSGSSLLNLVVLGAIAGYAAWVCLAARAPSFRPRADTLQ